jgi:hypothetical protein
MVRNIIRLVVVVLVVHAVVKIGPVFWTHFKFRDSVQDLAMFSVKRTEREVQDRVMDIAVRMDVPVERENVTVRKDKQMTVVAASYRTQLEYFPRRYYPWDFEFEVQGVPPRYTNVIP